MGSAWAEDPFAAHSLRTSMFFPATRLHVAGNPKAAGTTLRWWLLPAHGVDVAGLTARSLWSESAPYQTVWDPALDLRYTWPHLRAAERQDARTSGDVVTVRPVRHPVTRAFAAWAGKLLVGEAHYEQGLPARFPRLPDRFGSVDEIRHAFTTYVGALRDHVDADGWTDVDVHFWPQDRLLAASAPGDVIELRQEDMTAGLARIRTHLLQHGVDAGEPPRLNESVVRYQRDLLENFAVDVLLQLYAADLTSYGYSATAPDATGDGVDLDWLNDVRGRNRRFRVVHHAAMTARRRVSTLEDRLAAVELHRDELLASTSWRVTRPLRWAVGRMRGS